MSACLLSACSESPTAATPAVSDPGAPKISCPTAAVSVQSPDGLAVAVSYGTATVANGSTPLTGPTCTPASGTSFNVGSTTVNCTVTDARARTDSCTFAVTVLAPPASPKLSLTRFFAFGDSITAGEVVSEGYGPRSEGVRVRPLMIDLALAYPTALQRSLDVRYQTQKAVVVNDGKSGETTTNGVVRLPLDLSRANQPQVLLLLEGANDLGSDPSAVLPAVLNMGTMIRTGKARGLRVFVGTLPPQNTVAPTGIGESCQARNGGAALVVPFNNALKAVAAQESVTVVDVYQAFNGDVTTLIDCDGLHPTGAGYDVIAGAFFATIRQALELPATSSAPNLTLSPFLAQRRR